MVKKYIVEKEFNHNGLKFELIPFDKVVEILKAGIKDENWNRDTKGIWKTF